MCRIYYHYFLDYVIKYQNENLERDIKDLQAEFEFDRIDYLDTIRKQEQQVKWLEGVIDKIHPCLRRDCNYVNLDIVKVTNALFSRHRL